MPEPAENQFACIGCGAMNPIGAEVCSGCGHRFAGPEGEKIPQTRPRSAPAPDEARGSYQPSRPVSQPKATGCLVRLIKTVLTAIAAFFAFGVAFTVTCNAGGEDITTGIVSLLVGLAAAGIVIGFVFWLQRHSNSDRNQRKSERPKEDR